VGFSHLVYWCCQHHLFILGAFGDSATFFGGITLGWDALKRESEFKEIKDIISKRQSAPLARLKIDMDGIILSKGEDVERVFIHRSTRKAIWGCALLVLGFAALLTLRVLEILK
jgi:hypothetical protein